MNECVDEPGCASDLGDPACRHCLRAPEVGFPCPVQEGTAHGPRGRGPGSPGGSLLLSLSPESVRPQLPAGRKLGTRGDPLPPQPPAGLAAATGMSGAPGAPCPAPRETRVLGAAAAYAPPRSERAEPSEPGSWALGQDDLLRGRRLAPFLPGRRTGQPPWERQRHLVISLKARIQRPRPK